MKPLNKLQSLLFLIGGIMMVAGAVAYVLMWQQRIACWVFLAGSVLFAVIQSMQLYEGNSIVIRRLKRLMNMADLFLVLTGILMVDMSYRFLLPLFYSQGSDAYYIYIKYVYNKWVILLLVAVFLDVYSTIRISRELQREQSRE